MYGYYVYNVYMEQYIITFSGMYSLVRVDRRREGWRNVYMYIYKYITAVLLLLNEIYTRESPPCHYPSATTRYRAYPVRKVYLYARYIIYARRDWLRRGGRWTGGEETHVLTRVEGKTATAVDAALMSVV